MKFKKHPKLSYSAMEEATIKRWQLEKTFEKSVANRSESENYVFYDGPPFITGLPHHGNLLSSITKDVIPRYQTMRGKRVERRWGWDCHGLPAENLVEQKLNLKDKNAVLEYGLEEYITACRDSMVSTGAEWEETVNRIARWVEFKNAYRTMDPQYMESVWWAFKELYQKGSIYEGKKVLVYCTRCATPVSKAEVAMDDSYKTVTDPSVYIKFQLTPESIKILQNKLKLDIKSKMVHILAWTTTPWTLHANTAAAINTKLKYSLIEYEKEYYILASSLVDSVLLDDRHKPLVYKSVTSFKGSVLSNLDYIPIFNHRGENAHKIWSADYVTAENGTGIVHLAPAYGEEDYELALENGIPIVIDIDEQGAYNDGPWQGLYAWEANKKIAKELRDQGNVLRLDYIQHSYPHCHRCGTKLMYRAHPSWFMNIDDQRQRMVEYNKKIHWFPEHIKDGRFHNTIMSAPDWNLSRDRFWATPIPVWRGEDHNGKTHTIVVGSYKELEELSGKRLDDYHRPWVDNIEFEKDGVQYRRVDKVIDCWFESGSMPFAQFHYPFENKQKFEASLPGDFIVEYVGQVRAWFYYLHAVSTALFDQPAFKNVIVTGTILGRDGRKISKSLGNYTDPIELIDTHSADAYRLFLMGSVVMNGEDLVLEDKEVANAQRRLNTLRNTLEFFLLYASVDNWQATTAHSQAPPESQNLFDNWIIARLADTTEAVQSNLDEYNLPAATKPIIEFIDDLSNWYIRRNRKRFWKTDNDSDQDTAYHTLYFVLKNFAQVIAPICPFIAEEIYTLLTDTNQSVHLTNWPAISYKNDDLVHSMNQIRTYITDGLALRANHQLKVRQPLAELTIYDKETDLPTQLINTIAEELNIKLVHMRQSSKYKLDLDFNITDDLKREGLARELVRNIQALRKQAELDVDNRIKLNISTTDRLLESAIHQFESHIKSETLSKQITTDNPGQYEHSQTVDCDSHQATISLQKSD